MAAEFLPPEFNNSTHCGDQPTFGRLSYAYHYPTKAITQASTYPSKACQPWLHYNMRLGNLQLMESLYAGANGTFGGTVTAPTFVGNLIGRASENKSFDIPHVTQPGKRIRHVCAEGPEPGIYIRGRLKDSNKIVLPEYWEGLIDPDSITVTLTQIGYSQDLIVDSIDWGKIVKVRSGVGANIDCFYDIWAARWVNPDNHDEKLHVVYDGESPADYPGNNDNFIVGGFQ
jgi:hypothetical protein|tara:strand:- start:527 stop:1213 length:687 start_codon:yes stop_codon:yes gene_type:complete